ncbi:putative nucleotide-binding alpha-beta plait domain-containing protein [Rosa chinensis]|uniref:Putative nucleotide-binding alpha-beta plait domain-containing protein n=1 Tax=Rosa chinensis TaxID=74649 RepID=A0A2P6PA43_ROSCH|nr:28 kDa ribonucleoprotein, chloroplastic isoform X2 [Rosa chinensis]XP_040366516.1 28 kDa ribonucleoprotein, chloroplastic isoform X2 [Rosa chinensis]PRQ18794.1 putative nucleotide-binding alpha-beta plait domain-containing protein [Rosa chinensis]
MAAFEAALSLPSLYSPCSSKPLSFPKPLNLRIPNIVPPISHNFLFSPPPLIPTRNLSFELLCSAVQEITAGEEQLGQDSVEEKTENQQNLKRKLYVVNLPWSLTVVDIKNLFGECGDVKDVEIIKQQDGRNRGFAFVTMASGEEAQAVIDKFDSQELSGRTIKVEFAKQFKKPSPRPSTPQVQETRYKLYVSNLAWKARSSHLRDFVSLNFKTPVSARVVFDGPSGKSGGYGFVSFATKEEAEEAISALNGHELMGRPVNLKFSEKNVGESTSQEENVDSNQNGKEEEEKLESQPEES